MLIMDSLNSSLNKNARDEARKIFDVHKPKLKQMCFAGLESIYWRQDQYTTGGIVESDSRVDGGRKLYWPWCWPRTYIIEPLLVLGQFDRVKKFCNFWLRCQRPDGSWLHCYDVRDYSEFPGWSETDNVGYMLWHFSEYVKGSNDYSWLKQNWCKIEVAADFLLDKFDPKFSLIWGMEEAHIPGYEKMPIRYPLHLNCVCAKGLLAASELAQLMGHDELSQKYSAAGRDIIQNGIRKHLWDARNRTFSFGLTENGNRLTAAVAWMTPIPFWLFDSFDDVLCENLQFLQQSLYNKDSKIKRTYWIYDFDLVFKQNKLLENKYSGFGVQLGTLPVIIYACLKANLFKHAAEQLGILLEFTNPESNLVPEHINTLHPGELGNYSIYPKPYYYVDSGNLLHQSFFMTLIARIYPEILIESHQKLCKSDMICKTTN
ncbi:MAG: hypothetical protein A2007_03095 [Verrucomicrobia bacterium GWC2_42_7]|nr:MAG: hypothetical protein A2007_03095 [Verrucomicrobia bacterium GWC2_42_7]